MNKAVVDTDWAESFPYVAKHDAKVLVLGSIPGQASLKQVQYYAHPRNAFWPIMQAILGLPSELDYTDRLTALKEHKVALWDVAHQCHRPGSLDSRIDQQTVVPNTIETFLANHPDVKLIAFNGQAASKLFKRHFPALVKSDLIQQVTLPSTSPAHASLSFAEKLEAWQVIAKYL